LWEQVAFEPSVDGKYERFLSIVLRGFNECFPERRKLYRANKVGKIDLPSWLADLKREILNLRVFN
jgi:hypothetical protein